MDTTNVPVTKTWLKIADDGEEFCATSEFQQALQYLPNTTTPAATLHGHTLRAHGMAASRLAFPSGDVYVRIDPSSNLSAALLVLSK